MNELAQAALDVVEQGKILIAPESARSRTSVGFPTSTIGVVKTTLVAKTLSRNYSDHY